MFGGRAGLIELDRGIAGVVRAEVMGCGEANWDERSSAAPLQRAGEFSRGRDGDLGLTRLFIKSCWVTVKYILVTVLSNELHGGASRMAEVC